MIPKSRPPLARWVGLLALIVLAVGVVLAWRQWTPRSSASPPSAAPPDTVGEGPIRDAIVQADQDEKSRWVDEVPGVELAGLDGERKGLFLQVVNARRCTCGCGYTLAACRVYDTTCKVSLPRVEALVDSVRRGFIVASSDAAEEGAPGASTRR